MRIRIKDKDCTISVGEFLHIRCAAQNLNLIVTNDLKGVHDLITKFRNGEICKVLAKEVRQI